MFNNKNYIRTDVIAQRLHMLYSYSDTAMASFDSKAAKYFP